MSNLRNTRKVGMFAIMIITAALIGSVVAIAGDNNAAASSGGSNGGSSSGQFTQGIDQVQSSNQDSTVVSGGDTTDSGNNYSVQSNLNEGNNAFAGQ